MCCLDCSSSRCHCKNIKKKKKRLTMHGQETVDNLGEEDRWECPECEDLR